MELKEQIEQFAAEKLAETGSFLVEVKLSPVKIFVFIDNVKGIGLDECVSVSRFLQEKFEGTDVFERHELEVSSPGMNEPFKVLNQYLKRLGKKVSVLKKDGIRKDGVLKNATDEAVTIEETRKKMTEEVTIPMSEIKTTTLMWEMKV